MDSLKARLTQPLSGPDEISRPKVPMDAVADEMLAAAEADVAEDIGVEQLAAKELAGGVESVEDVHAPWTPIEETDPWAVPLNTNEPVAGIAYEAAAVLVPEPSTRPRWMVPAAVAGFIIVLAGGAWGVSHREAPTKVTTVAAVPTAAALRRPDTAAIASASTSDSAAGVIAPPVRSDSAEFIAIRDSIAAADAHKREVRLAKQAAAEAAAAKERAARTVTDSNGVKWTTVPPPPLDSVQKSAAKAKKDSAKVKPDTVVKPDTGAVHNQ